MCFFQIVGQFDPANHNELELSTAIQGLKNVSYNHNRQMRGYSWKLTSIGKSGPEENTGGVTSSSFTDGSPKARAVNLQFIAWR